MQAAAIVRCNYGASVPGGYVYYTQWPTAAAARQWHDDQTGPGPEPGQHQETGATTQSNPNQGPLHTRAASRRPVYATAAYADRPYGFDIVTPTLDGSNAMFTNMHLLPASSVPVLTSAGPRRPGETRPPHIAHLARQEPDMTDTRPSVVARAARSSGGRPGGAAPAALVAGLAVLTLVLGGCGSTGRGRAGQGGHRAVECRAGPRAPGGAERHHPGDRRVARPRQGSSPARRTATAKPGSQDQLTTSNGSAPVEATVCDYSRVAPGALVIFARWPDVPAAQSYYNDTANLGPRIENFDVWQSNGVQQGPLYTAQSEGRVISTGLYTGLPYSWEIRTATLEESNAVFGQVRFRPRSELGG